MYPGGSADLNEKEKEIHSHELDNNIVIAADMQIDEMSLDSGEPLIT